jgi:hypothetical protein
MTVSNVFAFSCLLAGVSTLGCGDDSPRESPWAGQTFLVDVPGSSWAEPRGVGAEFGAFAPQFLLAVEGGAEAEFEVHIGTARGGEQDRCAPTMRAPAVSDYPAVQIGPSAVNVHIVHDREPIQITTTILNFTLENVLPGAVPPDEGELTGMMDVRELYPMLTLLGPRRSADTVCTAVASFETECAPCPTDGAVYCLAVRANYFGARAVPLQIEPIAAEEIDPACLE